MAWKNTYNIYVAARDREFLRLTIYAGDEVVSLKYKIGLKDSFPKAEDPSLRALFSQLLH